MNEVHKLNYHWIDDNPQVYEGLCKYESENENDFTSNDKFVTCKKCLKIMAQEKGK